MNIVLWSNAKVIVVELIYLGFFLNSENIYNYSEKEPYI